MVQDAEGRSRIMSKAYSDFVEFLPCKDHERRIAARQAARVDARREHQKSARLAKGAMAMPLTRP